MFAGIWWPGHVAPPEVWVGGHRAGPRMTPPPAFLAPSPGRGLRGTGAPQLRGAGLGKSLVQEPGPGLEGSGGAGSSAKRLPPALLGHAWHAARGPVDPYARRVRPLVCGSRPGAGVRRARWRAALGRRRRGTSAPQSPARLEQWAASPGRQGVETEALSSGGLPLLTPSTFAGILNPANAPQFTCALSRSPPSPLFPLQEKRESSPRGHSEPV